MGLLEESVQRVLKDYYPNPKAFWGSPGELALGAGLVYKDIAYPLLDVETKHFDTVEGAVLVLTHECDISQENSREFNEDVLICPLLPFEDVVRIYGDQMADRFRISFIPSLSKHEISRVMYLPPVERTFLPHGALIYLNQICSTHVSMFYKKVPEAAISGPGLHKLDMRLQHHLLRPKSEALPYTYSYFPRLRNQGE